MDTEQSLNAFLEPRAVAVIGATERPGSWGAMIMEGLLSLDYPGTVYPVNPSSQKIFDIPAFKDIRDIPGPVDLAFITIPKASIEDIITACGEKQVKGIAIVTAGFGEIFETREGKDRQQNLKQIAHAYGMRLLGPNISGTFNLHNRFNGSAGEAQYIHPTSLAAVCQGGYAFFDLLASGIYQQMGVGKFIHTGNECDLTATDFLEHFGNDPDISGLLMYLETVRDGRRFFETAKQVTSKKPVVVYKAGRTPGSARAARSHTGALSGSRGVFQGLFQQTGIITSPTMELLVPLGHALVERPPMQGNRVAIITIGGSWGVTLSDALEEQGLLVVELSTELQNKLKSLGMPPRASTRNPVDIGAAGIGFGLDKLLAMGREMVLSGEIDALVVHGLGKPGMITDSSPPEMIFFLDFMKQIATAFNALEQEFNFPVIIGSHYSPLESQAVSDMTQKGIRVLNRLDDIAVILSKLCQYHGQARPVPATRQ